MYQTNVFNNKLTRYRLFSQNDLIRQNKYCKLYSHKCGFYKPYNLIETNRNNIGDMLANFVPNYGVLEQFKFYVALVHTGINTRLN